MLAKSAFVTVIVAVVLVLFVIFIIWNVAGPRSELAHDQWAVSRVGEGAAVLIKSDLTNILNIHILFWKFQLIGKVIRANIVYELSYQKQSLTGLYEHRVYDL